MHERLAFLNGGAHYFADENVVIAGGDVADGFTFELGKDAGEQGDAGFSGTPLQAAEAVVALAREAF
jgi:hypothetical protein